MVDATARSREFRCRLALSPATCSASAYRLQVARASYSRGGGRTWYSSTRSSDASAQRRSRLMSPEGKRWSIATGECSDDRAGLSECATCPANALLLRPSEPLWSEGQLALGGLQHQYERQASARTMPPTSLSAHLKPSRIILSVIRMRSQLPATKDHCIACNSRWKRRVDGSVEATCSLIELATVT